MLCNLLAISWGYKIKEGKISIGWKSTLLTFFTWINIIAKTCFYWKKFWNYKNLKQLLTGETWFLLTHVKNYRSANLLVYNQFISDLFPWKRMGLGRVGMKGKVSGQSRVASPQAVWGRVAKGPVAWEPRASRAPPAPERERVSPLFWGLV